MEGRRSRQGLEREREAASRGTCLPLALPTAIAVCSFVSNLKVVEGLTRKATGVEIYLTGMLLLARFVTRKLKALPVFLLLFSSFPAYGFIRHCRINAGDTLLFRRILLLFPRPANVFVTDSIRGVCLMKHCDRCCTFLRTRTRPSLTKTPRPRRERETETEMSIVA